MYVSQVRTYIRHPKISVAPRYHLLKRIKLANDIHFMLGLGLEIGSKGLIVGQTLKNSLRHFARGAMTECGGATTRSGEGQIPDNNCTNPVIWLQHCTCRSKSMGVVRFSPPICSSYSIQTGSGLSLRGESLGSFEIPREI